MMFNQLSLFTTFGIVILISTQCATQVTLTQKSTDVGLGVSDSMELVCSVTGAISSSRTWTGGPGFTPIVSSGVSIDPSKYTETLQTVDFSLHIHNVVEDDVCGVRYQCSNGFSTSQIETIVLNSSIFSYVPKTSEIQVQSEVFDNDKKMTILVNLTKVFPEPTCIAKFGERDITSKLLTNSYNNGNCGLKSSELSISNETYDCSGQLVITCIVGSYTVTAYTGGPSCPTTQTSMEYVVGGITTTNFNVELSRSTPIYTEEVTSTSDVIISMESPYDTNTVNTVILAYHSTDNLSMQTLDQSVKTISASQSIQATSVWNISKSSRTDLYFQESSSLLVTSSEASITLYDSFSSQSLNQTNFLSVQTQSDKVSFESTTTQSNISFTNTDGVPVSLQITYSSKYSIKSSGDISPFTVYPSSGLLRTDLFVQYSEVSLSVSHFEITNPGRLSTFSTNLESEFIDEITKTLKATNSYFLTDFPSSNSLVNDSFTQHNINRQPVTTSDPFAARFSSSGVDMQKESEYSESYFSNFSSILWTNSSYQYVSDTFERSINTDKDPSFLPESTQPITITESFHTMTNLKDDEISKGELETSLKITTLLSDYLIMDFQSNTHLLSTERSGYFVTTIQADIESSALEMEASHTKTSSNLRYSILHISAIHTFIHTLQSVVSSQIYSNSVMQSYRHYKSPGIELMSSYFKTSSQTNEKLHSSDTSYHISSKTPTVSKDTFTRIAKDDGHLSTTNLSISAIQTGIPAEQTIESSKMKIEFVTQTTETLSKSEYIEPGTSSFTYASTETLFHDSSLFYSSSSDFIIFTSDEFVHSLSPASDISSTSAYLTSTAIQNVISEQTKDIIVISTATSIICFSVLILLISFFVKKYLQKPMPIPDIKPNQIEWTNDIQSNDDTNKQVSSDSLYTGGSLIFTRLNTKWYSYTPPYQHNWDDI